MTVIVPGSMSALHGIQLFPKLPSRGFAGKLFPRSPEKTFSCELVNQLRLHAHSFSKPCDLW